MTTRNVQADLKGRTMRSPLQALTHAFVALALLLGAASTADAAKKTVHFYNDISGSPQMAVDADSGQVLWKENYKPYGERINNAPASSTGTGKNTLYFHGKQTEQLNGGVTLQYHGARYFRPETGRFDGVDPVHFVPPNVHLFNRFAFASNNPYKFTDTDGHQSMRQAHDPRLFAEQAWARFSAGASAAAAATVDAAVSLVPGSAAYACASGGCGAVGWGLASLDVAGPAGKAVSKVGKAIGPVAGGGAKIENLAASEATRIQNAANRTQTEISVVGSRANGTAGGLSDWDYVVPNGTSSRKIHSMSSSLPEGGRGLGEARNQDFFKGPVESSKPHITFTPQ
jgi:RHS repeat-associated protein